MGPVREARCLAASVAPAVATLGHRGQDPVAVQGPVPRTPRISEEPARTQGRDQPCATEVAA